MTDWLVAWDTGICNRLTHCTVCGRQPVTRWGVCGAAEHTLGYVLCRTHDTAGGVRAVEQLFNQRYAAPPVFQRLYVCPD